MKTRHPHTYQDYNRFIGWLHTFIFPKGRINRVRWWAGWGLNLLVGFPVFWIEDFAGASLEGLWAAIVIYPAIVVTIKRLHDLDHSGWLLLWFFCPIANLLFGIWLFFFCGFRQGQPCPNRFGKPIELHHLTLYAFMNRFGNRE